MALSPSEVSCNFVDTLLRYFTKLLWHHCASSKEVHEASLFMANNRCHEENREILNSFKQKIPILYSFAAVVFYDDCEIIWQQSWVELYHLIKQYRIRKLYQFEKLVNFLLQARPSILVLRWSRKAEITPLRISINFVSISWCVINLSWGSTLNLKDVELQE